MSGQLYLFTSGGGGQPWHPLNMRLGGHQFWLVGKKKQNILLLLRIKPCFISCPVHRLVSILTDLSSITGHFSDQVCYFEVSYFTEIFKIAVWLWENFCPFLQLVSSLLARCECNSCLCLMVAFYNYLNSWYLQLHFFIGYISVPALKQTNCHTELTHLHGCS